MPKTAKSQQTRLQASKFIVGAVLGAVIGTIAVVSSFSLAINALVVLIIIASYLFFLSKQRSMGSTWSPQAFSPAPALGALVIGVTSVIGLQFLGSSSAWHPKGKIIKSVQNITTGSAVGDANNSVDAIVARPGDIIQYNITIQNIAPPASKQYNDLAFVKMTDKLPDGVELVSNPAQRVITEDFGTILPGKAVSKSYRLKVTATKKDAIIINKACYSGDSVVRDSPQSGCDPGLIKIAPPSGTPPTPPTTTPPSTPPNTPPTPPSNPPNPPAPQPNPNPPTPTPPTPPTTTPPTPGPTTPTPPATPPTTTPPATPPSTTPPAVTPPTATPPASTPDTPAPPRLPNVGPGSIAVIALYAAVTGYIFSALYGLMRSRASRF